MTNTYYKVLMGKLPLLVVFMLVGFRISAQEIITVKQGTADKEVLLLPFSYTTDGSLIEKGQIKVTVLRSGKDDFKSQLYQAALQTTDIGGNVFMISRMQDHNQKGRYKIWGTAFHTDKYEQLKARAYEQRNDKPDNSKYACIVIYRPEYNRAFNDEKDMVVTINDTLNLEMKANTKYTIQIPKSCKVKIANKHQTMVQRIDVQPGNKYYFRAYIHAPGSATWVKNGENNVELQGYAPYFEMIDEMQGDLESSLVTLISVTKKLIVE